MNRSTAIVAALAVVFCFPVIAVDYDDEIFVTATRDVAMRKDVLQSTQVFTQDDILRFQPKDLPTLLGRMSGVDFRDSGGRGSTSGVFIRGASPSQSIILIDGVRSASATVGATALERIPIESIERIELVKGPVSSLYGADAIGGVIQIFTKSGQTKGLSSQFQASYRTDDTQQYTIELGAGNDRGRVHGTFSYENSQGIDRSTVETGGNADRDGFNEFALNVTARYRLLDQLSAQLNLIRTDSQNEFDNFFGSDNGRDSDSKVKNNSLQLIYTPSEFLSLNLSAGHFVDDIKVPVFNSDITTRRTSVSFVSNYQVHEQHKLTAGVDYYYDKVDTLSAFSTRSRDNIAGYLQWQGRYENFSAVGSVRYDDNEAYGSDTNGTVVIAYDLLEDLTASVSYGTAFRAPSFNDLFFPGFGNPDVTPEESETVELSLKGYQYGTRWRISAYHTDVKDLIGFDAFTFTANNTAEATLKGVEVEAAYTSGDWSISANTNYLSARDDTIDEYLDDRAEFAANIDVHRKMGKFDLSVDVQAESGRHDRRGTTLDGFVIFGFSGQYRFTDWFRLTGRIDNLFDENYTLNLGSATAAYRTYGRTAAITLHASYD